MKFLAIPMWKNAPSLPPVCGERENLCWCTEMAMEAKKHPKDLLGTIMKEKKSLLDGIKPARGSFFCSARGLGKKKKARYRKSVRQMAEHDMLCQSIHGE